MIDAVSFKNTFDAQHFLNLVLHRHAIFEVQGSVRSELKPPIALVRKYTGAKFIANTGVLLEAVEIVPG